MELGRSRVPTTQRPSIGRRVGFCDGVDETRPEPSPCPQRFVRSRTHGAGSGACGPTPIQPMWIGSLAESASQPPPPATTHAGGATLRAHRAVSSRSNYGSSCSPAQAISFTMAINSTITLGCMARAQTKRVPQAVVDHFCRELTQWVNEAHGGNQSSAAKSLGVTQSAISGVMTGARGPGLQLLLRLREKTGKSCDELLGVGPSPDTTLVEQLRASYELEVARFRAAARGTLEEANAKLARIAQLEQASQAAHVLPQASRPKTRRR